MTLDEYIAERKRTEPLRKASFDAAWDRATQIVVQSHRKMRERSTKSRPPA